MITQPSQDELFMSRCLQLARYAEGATQPNPMVGAVVVCDGKVIGEGYHKRAGEPHAEVNAINSVHDKTLLPESTLYVSLEPCSHWGKTPPCAELIIRSQIGRVVVGMFDVNPEVNGRGVELLRNAGVEVKVGVLEDECKWLNRRFITAFEKKRPYVILKWAETSDGFIDYERADASTPPLRISNEVTKTLNHQIRSHEGAIMVATNTALKDNPHLTSRKWSHRNPVRVIIDRTLRIRADYKIFDQAAETIIFNEKEQKNSGKTEFVRLDFSRNIIPQMLDHLHSKQIQSVIVEGGQILLNSFIEAGLWDECHVETSPATVGSGVPAPTLKNAVLYREQMILSNIYRSYKPTQS